MKGIDLLLSNDWT